MDKKDFWEYELVYREYTELFWIEMTSTLWANSDVFKYIPIIFTNNTHVKNGDQVYGVTHVHTNTATNIAVIYPIIGIIDVNAKQKIEATIRHEAIHYLLGISYKCHSDSSALFWLVCDCFDGNAYSEMDNKSRKVYDLAKPYVNKIHEMYKLTKNIDIPIKFSLILSVIDNTEFDTSPDFDDMIKSLDACLNAAKISCSHEI